MKVSIVVASVLTAAIVAQCGASVCNWNINKDLPYKDPVFFRREGHRGSRGRLLVPPSPQGLQLVDRGQMELFCPGTANYVQQLGREEVQATCSGGSEVTVDGLTRYVKDLGCVKDIVADVQETKKHCLGQQGRVLSIGYNSPAGWLHLFEVCYDHAKNLALYSHHVVYGTAMAGAYIGNDRPGFKSNGLQKNVSVAASYRRATQTTRFSRLLGRDIANFYINQKSFLSRGHLAPDADFLMHSWQRATYFYVNVIPQWQSINGANWARIENAVRNVAIKKNADFKVWTGSEGILELEDENHNKVKMYLLDNNNLPIPKYIWKVICNIRKECIAFVVLNNPFEQSVDKVCQDVCKDTNWFQDGYDDVSKGAVTCCDVNEIRNTFTAIPKIAVQGLMRVPTLNE